MATPYFSPICFRLDRAKGIAGYGYHNIFNGLMGGVPHNIPGDALANSPKPLDLLIRCSRIFFDRAALPGRSCEWLRNFLQIQQINGFHQPRRARPPRFSYRGKVPLRPLAVKLNEKPSMNSIEVGTSLPVKSLLRVRRQWQFPDPRTAPGWLAEPWGVAAV